MIAASPEAADNASSAFEALTHALHVPHAKRVSSENSQLIWTFFAHRPLQNHYAAMCSLKWYLRAHNMIGQFHFHDEETTNPDPPHGYQSIHANMPRSSQSILYANLVDPDQMDYPNLVRSRLMVSIEQNLNCAFVISHLMRIPAII